MSNLQEVFNKTIHHMRAQGNPWGDYDQRGWTYVNPDNPCQRCAKGIHMDVFFLSNRYTVATKSMKAVNEAEGELGELLDAMEAIFEFKKEARWEAEFAKVASKFNLAVPSIKETIKHEDKVNG